MMKVAVKGPVDVKRGLPSVEWTDGSIRLLCGRKRAASLEAFPSWLCYSARTWFDLQPAEHEPLFACLSGPMPSRRCDLGASRRRTTSSRWNSNEAIGARAKKSWATTECRCSAPGPSGSTRQYTSTWWKVRSIDSIRPSSCGFWWNGPIPWTRHFRLNSAAAPGNLVWTFCFVSSPSGEYVKNVADRNSTSPGDLVTSNATGERMFLVALITVCRTTCVHTGGECRCISFVNRSARS